MQKYTVKSLDLALNILEFISNANSEGVSVSEVSRVSDTTKSNAYGILQTLVNRGYLSDTGKGMTRRYRIGPMFLQMSNAVTLQRPFAQTAQDGLAELSQETGMLSRFGMLEGGYAVALYKQDVPGPIQLASALGRRELPHCSGLGKALISVLSPEEIKQIIKLTGLSKRTDKTITTINRLLLELETARLQGYAVDDEEDNVGIFCVGSPIMQLDGTAYGAISVSALKYGKSIDDIRAIGEIVKAKAIQIAQYLPN